MDLHSVHGFCQWARAETPNCMVKSVQFMQTLGPLKMASKLELLASVQCLSRQKNSRMPQFFAKQLRSSCLINSQ